MLGLLLGALGGCAAAKPGTLIGIVTLQDWERRKAERLNICSHKPGIDTATKARRCLRGYKTHRGTPTCTDAAAWIARVEAGIESS